ncbi:MAG: glycerol-3-phosphate 1-O-acyltransferase PlsY [Candidatus Aminicenantes bacterium]|jgi:glycerol-3-phosphate acyltransferase PlsY
MKILFAGLSYLFGAIPSGYILFYIREKKDIRDFGSQATGATNMLRLKGWRYAVPVLLFDTLKGILPVLIALELFEDLTFALVCAFLAVVGHCFPVYIKFRGGKGLATALGAYAVLAFMPLLFSLALFILIIGITRYVSLGSLLAIMSFPVFNLLYKNEIEIVCLGIVLFILIAFMHRENIARLVKGHERKLGEKAR